MNTWRRVLLVAIVGILAVLVFVPPEADGQDSIQVLVDEFTVNYPFSVRFTLSAESAAEQITEVRLVWRAASDDPFSVNRVNIRPGQTVDVEFPLNVRFLSLPPFAQITYQWRIQDSGGSELVTERQTFEYEDTRNSWLELENERVRLLYYDLDEAFAAELFGIADEAYQRLAADFGVELDDRPIVIVYPDQAAFTEFQSLLNNLEYVVGRYFPGHNITVNLVTPNMERDVYETTIAHELSHLYSDSFYVGYGQLPLWLEEGLATFNEGGAGQVELQRVQRAAARGDLIPFVTLPAAIRAPDIRTASLAYAEGATIFRFIQQTWGQSAIADFLGAFRRTTNVGDVTRQLFDLDIIGFELAWRDWLGYPVETVPQLMPTPTLQIFTFPTPTYSAPGG